MLLGLEADTAVGASTPPKCLGICHKVERTRYLKTLQEVRIEEPSSSAREQNTLPLNCALINIEIHYSLRETAQNS